MYKPAALCLNDFDVSYNKARGCYELIHLQGPPIPNDAYDATTMETTYGNAFSHDLVNWEPQPDVFSISDKDGAFDNSAIWTMHTIYAGNQRMMFYTGVAKEPYFHQSIGLALNNEKTGRWERYKDNPIVEANPRYYQTEGKMAWRDPYVVFDEKAGHYVMFISAKDKTNSEITNGCIATAFSTDLKIWDVQPPLISPNMYYEMECPVSYKMGDFHYLFVSTSDTMRVRLWRAENLMGPYEDIGFLTDPYHYAVRVIRHEGRDMALHTQWVHKPSAENKNVSVPSRGYLCDPREILRNDDGTLYLEPLAGDDSKVEETEIK